MRRRARRANTGCAHARWWPVRNSSRDQFSKSFPQHYLFYICGRPFVAANAKPGAFDGQRADTIGRGGQRVELPAAERIWIVLGAQQLRRLVEIDAEAIQR